LFSDLGANRGDRDCATDNQFGNRSWTIDLWNGHRKHPGEWYGNWRGLLVRRFFWYFGISDTSLHHFWIGGRFIQYHICQRMYFEHLESNPGGSFRADGSCDYHRRCYDILCGLFGDLDFIVCDW
jgi:hypothetical protein